MIIRKAVWQEIRTRFTPDEQMALTAAVCRETPFSWELDTDALAEPLIEKLAGLVIHAVDMGARNKKTRDWDPEAGDPKEDGRI